MPRPINSVAFIRASVFPLERVGFSHTKRDLQLERKWAVLFIRKTKGLKNSDWVSGLLGRKRNRYPYTLELFTYSMLWVKMD